MTAKKDAAAATGAGDAEVEEKNRLEVNTPAGWQPVQAEFYKPVLRWGGQEYLLERFATGANGFMQIELMTEEAARQSQQAVHNPPPSA